MRKQAMAGIILILAGLLPFATSVQGQDIVVPDDIASEFSATAKTFVDTLDAETEKFSVRINRCQDAP
ncbi:hypothetical protein FPY71_01530 [Aureimonas fodinaquatilis]|uniref:Uncharacterized protein n=1 Tax=Aureimonas fodinaquatilis TaxID=2565783 RepID=A0A5B0E336_9HYPH|nr:hypothetical protein [Aureimonas fodinaquatilis]KAA0971839.1 hypothetical protein FPY71_01530 [Aureimonas fodinaquatilis]